MTLFVYKFIREAKPFLFIILVKMLEYRNLFLLLFYGSINKSHGIALQYKSLLGGQKIYKMLATNSRSYGC